MKLLYFHVPKTAGSSINKFFSTNLLNHHFHIESVANLNKDWCEKYQFLSGHVSYNRMNAMINLNEWITFATFREPLSYVISHLKWVRKLAEDSESERLAAHPKIFQDIAIKMKEYDFSNANQITMFIQWLESINFYYFHNTQTHYMNQTNEQGFLSDAQIDIALNNMEKINFIGVQESLSEYMELISYEFGWNIDLNDEIRVNTNENNYGFDISNIEIQKALLPLYQTDILIYEKAKKLFKQQQALYLQDSYEDIIGFIDYIDNKEIRGWVRSRNSLKKIHLELRYKNIIHQETLANIYREGLKLKEIHPTGLSQFKFKINDEKIDFNNYSIIIKGTNITLPWVNSIK